VDRPWRGSGRDRRCHRGGPLIEELLTRLAGWPAGAVYAIVALAAVLENIIPPMPSDAIIALAAFLSHRGTTDATTVFLITWAGSVGGAGVVYLLARRYGPAFFASRVGRRVMTPEAVVEVEREYLRFGLAGIFLARLLPGFRSFTAPFLGLMRIGALRAFFPVAVASGVWYGAVIFFAARLGRDWDNVARFVTGLNRTAGGLAILVLAAIGITWVFRRRRKARAELQTELAAALAPYPALEQRALVDPAVAALVALLVETEASGGRLSPAEVTGLEQHLRARLHVGPGERMPAPEAARLLARLEPAQRAGLADRMREALFGDESLRRHEAHVMERVATLLDQA
jgi:membrane protein DedA with SNARE-associated domain